MKPFFGVLEINMHCVAQHFLSHMRERQHSVSYTRTTCILFGLIIFGLINLSPITHRMIDIM